ncbi:MAG TPA: acyl-CoA dehydrogenase family protein [Kiloniellales bacterium]|nr:acyl-CoA dehydrogenase family protein [Kiloniellales bacterium]
MNSPSAPETTSQAVLLPDILELCEAALPPVERFEATAKRALEARIAPRGRIDPALLESDQFAAHGFAWLATYVAALREGLHWAQRLETQGDLGELERLILQAGWGEYLAQLTSGIALSQLEVLRPQDLGLEEEAVQQLLTPEVRRLIASGNRAAVRQRIAELSIDGHFGKRGLDETDALIAEQFQRFADEHAEAAHRWHLADDLIPLEVVRSLADLGVFGLTIPEDNGGLGLGKTAMCVVTEELSRGYIGLGSLGTRSEIAAELIRLGGTPAQKERWLPAIASGAILPTAVFTEPNTGSDLGALRTRAQREGDVYKITGNKTWITHGARSDLMTLLVRTDPESSDYRGLSMLLAEKPRGTDEEPFPAAGMSGGEIPVLGYRGMKEYEIAFDDFEVPLDGLLGGVEGQGFKQLMATFESARIQTAARAVGVAQNAMELGLAYARDRKQFGKAIHAFPRVSGKLAWMVVETMLARQLTLFAAREKDQERRCDIEAGMAKLLAARVAWANADGALQIHGGNGYAEEYPISRVLCDARILNIFEGAAEIQAQVITRGLLAPGRN